MSDRIAAFKKVIALEEVAKVPVIPTLGGWVARFSGVPVKELLFDPEAFAQAHIRAQKEIGYDALFAYLEGLCIPEAFGCPLVFRPSGLDVTPLELKDEADVKALPEVDIRRDGRLPILLKAVEKLVRSPEREVPVLSLAEGPFTASARILGADKMMKGLFKNRSMIERLIDKTRQLISDFGRALAEIGVDGLIIADPVSSSTMISPKFYQEFVLPHLQRLIKGLGMPVILHVCGDTQPILHLMAETGAKVLSLDQCMDLAAAKKTVAGRCGIGGNVDPMVLLFGTPEDVKRETLRSLEQGGKKGFILMAGCAVPPATSVKNLKTMIEVAKGYRM